MAISEAARSDLYTGLSEVIGPERAEVLMNAIPLHDLDEVATKGDMATLKAELKGDLATLKAELKADIAELETSVMAATHRESAALRKSFTNWMLTLMVAIIGAMIGVGLLT